MKTTDVELGWTGTWYWTYICSTVTVPFGSACGNVDKVSDVISRPPTKKLPCFAMVRGLSMSILCAKAGQVAMHNAASVNARFNFAMSDIRVSLNLLLFHYAIAHRHRDHCCAARQDERREIRTGAYRMGDRRQRANRGRSGEAAQLTNAR